MPRLFARFDRSMLRLVDGLADPARGRRTALALALGYAAAWAVYGIVAKSSQDLHADIAEMIVWMREPALGYPKHPPFPMYLLWLWLRVFPPQDWAVMLFAALNMGAALYFAFLLAAEWLKGDRLAVSPFLLATIPFYNFLAFKYDANAALLPLWPLAMWAFVRSLRTNSPGWAVLAGLAAAAAMLSKYWSAFLVAGMMMAALLDRRRNAYFRSVAPWLTVAVFAVAVAPHAWWLVRESFPPLTWVSYRRVATSTGDLIGSLAEYLAGTVGYAVVALLLVAIFVRPPLRALTDGLFPRDERRGAAALFWTPIILPLAVSAATGVRLLSLWSISSLHLLPVMLLGSPRLALPRTAVVRIAGVATAFTLLVVAASPVVGFVILRKGVENDAAYARLAMQAAEREWRAVTDRPLTLIGGPFVLVSSAAFYGSDRPSTYSDFSKYLSPWVDEARIARDGMAVMVAPNSPYLPMTEQYLATAPVARRTEVTLVRRWLGFEGPPRKFLIAIVPPRP